MYKMVVLDLDGTLLNDKKQISERNVEIIKKIYKEKGVFFVIATGRDMHYVVNVTKKIKNAASQYMIASNGAIIKDNMKNEYILKNCIDQTDALKMIDAYRKRNMEGLVYTCREKVTEEERQVKANPEAKLVKDLKTYLESNMSPILMLTACGNEKDLEEIKQEIKIEFNELEATDICDFLCDLGEEVYQTKYIDIMKKGSSKANAIKILADYLHIHKEEIIAMGDGANDLPMFEAAGYRVAMENGNEKLKAQADYITITNNQDGVAKALEEIFYKGEDKA